MPLLAKDLASPYSLGFRPALDGVRGVSILLVLAAHVAVLPLKAGFVGVDIFFVLSGFLITSLLVEEQQAFGWISLKLFYARRALRLLPAFIAVYLALCGFSFFFETRDSAQEIAKNGLISLMYVANWLQAFDRTNGAVFTHTWSLSVEEQFYMVWPWLLILLFKVLKRRNSLFFIIVLGVFVVTVYRVTLFFIGFGIHRIAYGTDTRADSLLMGAAAAFFFRSETVRKGWAQLSLTVLAWAAIPTFAWACGTEQLRLDYQVWIVYPAVSLAAAFLLLGVTVVEHGLLYWLLTRPWLVYIGRLSYGLYLWHWPIVRTLQLKGYSPKTVLLVGIPLSCLATFSCYHLVEKPMLNLKKRSFTRVVPLLQPIPIRASPTAPS